MKYKLKHHFILVLRGVNQDTPLLEDTLFEAGCDDALISYKNGVVFLIFDREAPNLEIAIISAIQAIETSPLHAKVDHVEDAFVTLSEIAQKSGFTKQAISLFIKGERGNGKFPVPFCGVNSSSPIWRWSDVLQWLTKNEKIQDNSLLADAKVIDNINLALQLRTAQHLLKYKKLLTACKFS